MSLKKIKGHSSQIKVLLSSLEKGTLAHAFLFYGQEGIGKETLARELTKILNCDTSLNEGCGHCSNCLRINSETFSDFHILRPSGASRRIKMEDVQSLQKSLNLSRYEGKAKVVLLIDADCLNEASSNALLKILEEPVERTYFFLISSNQEAILSTIRSRCRQIPFYPLEDKAVEELLIEKGIEDEAQRELLIRLSEGSVGRALRFHEDKGRSLRQSVIKFALTKHPTPSEALFFSEQLQKIVGEDKTYLWDILKIFEGVYRDLLVLQWNGSEDELFNPDWIQGLKQLTNFYSLELLEQKIRTIERIRKDLHMNAQLKFSLDYLLLNLAVSNLQTISV